MESVFAAIGLISIITVVSLADALVGASGAEATALITQGDSLAQMYDWAFRWGPGLVAGIGNGIMLGYLMYRSELVPRRMAMLGLIGGPLLIFSFVLTADRRLRERRGTFRPLHAPRGRLGAVARDLLRLEGLPDIEPAREREAAVA